LERSFEAINMLNIFSREKYGNLELFDPADDETTLVSGSAKKSKRRKRDEDNDDDDDTESITELLDQSSLLD
jgi:hypothetical protein